MRLHCWMGARDFTPLSALSSLWQPRIGRHRDHFVYLFLERVLIRASSHQFPRQNFAGRRVRPNDG